MKSSLKTCLVTCLLSCLALTPGSASLLAVGSAHAVTTNGLLEPLGLDGLMVTSLGLYGSVLAAGTDGDGVYWQVDGFLPDSSWIHIELAGLNVRTVYVHKSGPVGWAIGAGVVPAEGDTLFTYCSFLGQEFVPNSEGISLDLTSGVSELDGFPDPSVCGETYAAAGRAVYRRDFGGATWTPVYIGTVECDIGTVTARDDVAGVVLAGGAEGFAGFLLIKSLDFGDSWQDISPVLAYVHDVDFLGETAEVIFVASSLGVLRSLDGGGSWDEVLEPPVPDHLYVTEISIDASRPRVWAAGMSQAGESLLFYSDDLGGNWQPVALELAGAITDLEVDQLGTLYLAHHSEGVFRIDATLVDVVDDIPPRPPAILYQNFPNPFNPDTTLPFLLRDASAVVLTIVDMSGRRVRELLRGKLNPGLHVTQWDGTGTRGQAMPSGVYFYRLQVDDYQVTSRMTLIR